MALRATRLLQKARHVATRARSFGTQRAKTIAGRRTLYTGGETMAASVVPLAGPRALVRLLVGGAAAAAGYTTYQAMEAKAWLEERAGSAFELARNVSAIVADALGAAMALGGRPDEILGDGVQDRGASNEPQPESPSEGDAFNGLLRRMVEVRSLLRTAGGDAEDAGFLLPSIVVVGGQSSGKSSVLEAIVGREFLPKGGGEMVTRRPLELTLVHTPDARRAYAVFGPRTADGGTAPRIYDFAAVRSALEQMNASVPADECISEAAIELSVHAADVPDLTLVDLPGFVQLSAAHQPPGLRARITRLAERYIRQDNIVLAVCPADVDLANSEALKASRAVDPSGERTLGVLTKLDLVNAETADALLTTQHARYPLALGYVGVACPSGTMVQGSKRRDLSDDLPGLAAHTAEGRVGVAALRRRMCAALEARMAASLGRVSARVAAELAATRYSLKVEYADRVLSPAAYAADVVADARQAAASVADAYGRGRVCDSLRALLHKRALDVLREAFWTSDAVSEDHGVQREKLERLRIATDRLTHSGVGRASADAVVDAIVADVRDAIAQDAAMLRPHVAARERVLAQIDAVLRRRCEAASEAVENALRPLKSELAWTAEEWAAARSATHTLLHGVADDLEQRLRVHEQRVGHCRLVRAARAMLGERDDETPSILCGHIARISGVSSALLGIRGKRPVSLDSETRKQALEAAHMHANLRLLRERVSAIPACRGPSDTSAVSRLAAAVSVLRSAAFKEKSRIGGLALAPSNERTHVWHPCQSECPEVFLHIVAERLAETAALHVHDEVVHEFVRCVPGVVSASVLPDVAEASSGHTLKTGKALFDNGISKASEPTLTLLAENPAAMRHWTLQERMRVLEEVQQRLAVLQHMRS